MINYSIERVIRARVAAVVCAAVTMLTASVYSAMVVQGYQAIKHDRFQNNAAFIASAYDLSGAGMTDNNPNGLWATLVTPSYALTAAHQPGGGTVRFYQTNNPAGAYFETTLTGVGAIAGTALVTQPQTWRLPGGARCRSVGLT